MKKTAKHPVDKKYRKPIFPPAINKGDTIGLIAPAGSLISRENFTNGVQILEKKGFKVKYNQHLLQSKGYLAGTDEQRAEEFNKLWADPDVKAIVAARGGYGCLRLVDLLDMKQIRRKPKILIGFSDLTVLLSAIHKKTGLVTYHGPVVTTLASIDKKSQTCFFQVLAGKASACIKSARCKILRGGNARGVLLGGNLTTLVHTIATPYEIPWDQAILFIEDIGEAPYRLDRLLTHLAKAGKLKKIKGLILGTFTDDEKKEKGHMKKTVQDRVLDLLAGLDVPIWSDFPVGHGRRNLTLPIGIEAMMDSDAGLLRFL